MQISTQHPHFFRGEKVGDCFPDLIVGEDEVVVELKAVPELLDAHKAQLLSYLKATGIPVGLILNFGTRAEVKRFSIDRNGNELKLLPPIPAHP